jgi:hypothetical protein
MQATAKRVKIPFNYTPRPLQLPFWKAMQNAGKPLAEGEVRSAMNGTLNRGVKVWHRRYGKDKSDWNFMIDQAMEYVGVYFYFLPTYSQAKKVIWDGIGKDGFKFIEHIPAEIIKSKNKSELQITLVNDSIIQLIGTDNYDSIMGTNPRGCVFSEFSLQNPMAWEFIRPILKENKGWALFNFTPRGKNHAYDIYKLAEKSPLWFCQLLTVADTRALSPEEIQEERDEGMEEDMIRQEYYCSFEGSIHGAYYSKLIHDAREQGRIKEHIPIEPSIPVDTYWDLGMDDSTSIWFIQQVNNEPRAVGYYENSGEGLEFYSRYLQEYRERRKFTYGVHMFPHDVKVRELGTGVSRTETLKKLGIKADIMPQMSLNDGINAVRQAIPVVWFDETECEKGIKCLENYRKEYDEINKCFKNKPLHDWCSHGADAFRTFGTTVQGIKHRRRIMNNLKNEDGYDNQGVQVARVSYKDYDPRKF